MKTSNRAAILLAHGSSDNLWLAPFELLLQQLQNRLGAQKVVLAYMELAEPSLARQVQNLVQQGYDQIEIIPLFFAKGMHLRKQVPKLLAQLSSELLPSCPQLSLVLHEPVGLEAEVATAISQVIARKLA
ncbi:MAG: hypothetical protein RL217_784 [Pseudomonadota bacterium]|jgi:sirohydrochlorin cobaltochelatase